MRSFDYNLNFWLDITTPLSQKYTTAQLMPTHQNTHMCHCLYGCVTLGWKPKCGSDVKAIIAHYIQAAVETLFNLVRIMEDTVCKLIALDLGRADARNRRTFSYF